MQFVSLGANKAAIPLTNESFTLGRAHCEGHDTRISRRHAAVSPAQGGVTVTALKPIFVQSGPEGEVKQLCNGSAELSVGDVIYLLKAGGSYTAGFQLQTTDGSTGTCTQAAAAAGRSLDAAADEPVAKRHKAAAAAPAGTPKPSAASASLACAGGRSDAAAAPATAAQHLAASTGPAGAAAPAAEPRTFHASIAVAAQAGSPAAPPDAAASRSPAAKQQRGTPQQGTGAAAVQQQSQEAPQQDQQQQLFAGVRLVDWDGHHTQMAMQRAGEEGAVVSPLLEASTTHILARHELSAAEVHRRLQAGVQKQKRLSAIGKRPSPRSKQQHKAQPSQLPQAGSPQGPLVSSQDHTQPSPATQQQHQQQGKGGRSGISSSACGEVPGSTNLLPAGVQFVTVAWISSCLRAKQRLPEGPFHIALQHQLQQDPSGSHTLLPPQPAHAPASAAANAGTPSAAAAAGGGSTAEGGSAAPTLLHSPPAAAAACAGSPAAAAAAAPGYGPAALSSPTSPGGQLGVSREGQLQRRVQLLVPAPEEVCAPGAAWGTDNRWIEPWDDAEALNTMERLMTHWYQTNGRRAKPAAAATPTSPAGGSAQHSRSHSHSSSSSREDAQASDHEDAQTLPFHQQQTPPPPPPPQQQQQQQGPQMAGSSAGGGGGEGSVCEHQACSRLCFCLVDEMERLKKNYHGRVDQFRIKAASRTIVELERLQQPIVVPQDIEALPIGEKSKQKLQEILHTGRLRRNDMLEGSELHQTLQLFMTVWGCAEATARRWWAEGCRSLDDVRAKGSSLTAIQQMGLKYYDDFERRIPRSEVAEAVGIIRSIVLDVLQGITGKARGQLDQQLHVRALGSYVQGKPDTGDIDMLLAPGPAAEVVRPGPLLRLLLQRLKADGYVPEGLTWDHRSSSLDTSTRVSWMGVYKGPSSPCFRRLDIKAYQRAALPCAVAYFSSGQDCSRALRYWCNKPPPEVAALAAAIHPAANAFHLSDAGLYAVYKAQRPKAAAAASPGSSSRKRPRTTQAASTAGAAGAAAEEEAGGQGLGAGAWSDDDGDGAAAAARAAGIAIMTADGRGPEGPDGRVECSCESDVFRAIGLTYVPPHLRTWR